MPSFPGPAAAEPNRQDYAALVQQAHRYLAARAERLGAAASKRFRPDLYDHIDRQRRVIDQLVIKPNIVSSRVPIIGPVLDRLRQPLHELTLYYVNQLAYKQAAFDVESLDALTALIQDLGKILPEEMTATIHMMTASLSLGDAIGNYILTLRHWLTSFGFKVHLYADSIAPDFPVTAHPSALYPADGQAVLWYHYSIGADNLKWLERTPDYCLMDFHGVTPSQLFSSYDRHLETLCRMAEERLPELRDRFEVCVVHSEYSRQILQQAGYTHIQQLPLIVETEQFDQTNTDAVQELTHSAEYLLFVGRVVPQKDILALLKIFREVQHFKPDSKLIIVGGRQLAPDYQQQIDRFVAESQLSAKVIFTGVIKDRSVLSSLYRQARFTLIVSEWESFCVPAVESMYCGTPIATHAVPPLPEVMGAGGITIDKRNPLDAAEKINALWADSPQRQALQQAAQERAQHFTDAVLRRELFQMLQQVLI